MGLAERRRIATIAEQVPAIAAQIQGFVGDDIPFTFDATSLPENKVVLDSFDSYNDYYGLPMMVKVIKEISRDKMGKEALRDKVKAIRFVNTSTGPDDSGEKTVSISPEGELVVKCGFYGSSDKLWGADELREKIEAML